MSAPKRLPSPRTGVRPLPPVGPAAPAPAGGGGVKLPPSMQAAFAQKELGAIPEVTLDRLPSTLTSAVYVDKKWPFVIDVEGLAKSFLKYFNGAVMVSVKNAVDMHRDNLRKTLVNALKGGIPMVLDFGDNNVFELDDLFDPEYFPPTIFNKEKLFEKDSWSKLLRPGEQATELFHPSEDFIFVCLTSVDLPPKRTAAEMKVMRVVDKPAEGGEDPLSNMSTSLKPWQKLNERLRVGAFEGDLAMVTKAYDEGANLESADHEGYTALSEAAVAGRKAVVAYLLGKGARTATRGGKDRRTPLFRAAFNGHTDVCLTLLQAGADPDAFELKNFNEETTKLLAKWDRQETAKRAAERAAAHAAAEEAAEGTVTPEEKQKRDKKKILDLVFKLIKEGNTKGVREYVEAGVPVEATDGKGNTLLAIAAWEDQMEIAQMLVKDYKSNVNARDENGWSVVTVAAFHDRRRMVQYLLAQGANPLLRNKFRKSALDMAKGPETIKVLKAHIDGTQLDLAQTDEERAAVYAGPITENQHTWKPTGL